MLAQYLFMLVLFGILVAAWPTTREILRQGNDADPLRRELEKGRPDAHEPDSGESDRPDRTDRAA